MEIHIGTDPLARCGRGADPVATGSSAWGMDVRPDSTSTDKINVADLGSYTSGLKKNGTSPGAAGYNRRWDVRPGTTVGKWIGAGDLSAISSVVPIPMHGMRAFALFSVCSAHKVFND